MNARAEIRIWSATGSDLAWHYAIRHRVFVEEQGALVLTDLDDVDRGDQALHVVGALDGEIAGTVRLHPTGDDRWRGDRLAVIRSRRTSSLGAHLVRYAVSTAAAAGGSVMDAQIQLANVRFFEHLGWRRAGPVRPYLGIDHQPMAIDLPGVPVHDGGGRPAEVHLCPGEVPCVSALLEPIGGPVRSDPPVTAA